MLDGSLVEIRAFACPKSAGITSMITKTLIFQLYIVDVILVADTPFCVNTKQYDSKFHFLPVDLSGHFGATDGWITPFLFYEKVDDWI